MKDNLTIRKATPIDVKAIAHLFMTVMDRMVYRFIGESDFQKGIDFFIKFIQQTDNQYSYQNCFVASEDGKVIGVINIYDGEDLETLRQPVLDEIHKHFNPDLTIEDETQAGESYIDVIAVNNLHQRKGIGSKLLTFAMQECCVQQQKTLGLLVDKQNPGAKKLYLRTGFKKVGEKMLSGHEMEHLQYKI